MGHLTIALGEREDERRPRGHGACLAHHVGTAVERAYARSDLLAKRRRLMDRWGRFVTEIGGAEVVKLHG